VYVLGGDGSGGLQSTVYMAQIDTNGDVGAFSTASQGQLPMGLYRHNTVTTAIGGTTYMYVLGGRDGNSNDQSTVYKAQLVKIPSVNTALAITTNPNNSTNLSLASVGINTSAPTANLDVVGSASLSGNLAFNGTGTNNIYMLNNSSLNFVTSPAGAIDNNVFSTTNQGQLPQVLETHSTVTASIGGTNYVYVLGGYSGSVQSTVYKAAVNTSGDIGAFSTTSQTQLPKTLMDHNTVIAIIGGTTYAYVLGGNDDTFASQSTV
jgi:hypothetical protein